MVDGWWMDGGWMVDGWWPDLPLSLHVLGKDPWFDSKCGHVSVPAWHSGNAFPS